jgi:adenosine kinase
MIEHAQQFAAARIPVSFSTQARGCRCSAARNSRLSSRRPTWVAVNDYEWGMLQQKTGMTAADIMTQVKA